MFPQINSARQGLNFEVISKFKQATNIRFFQMTTSGVKSYFFMYHSDANAHHINITILNPRSYSQSAFNP